MLALNPYSGARGTRSTNWNAVSRQVCRQAWKEALSKLRRGAWRGILLGLLATSWSQAAHADIYRYVDKDGTIHFSNKKKKGAIVARKGASARRAKTKKVRSIRARRASKNIHRYDAYIQEAASLYQIPVQLVQAVIQVESGFNPGAVSHANARGLMQLIPATAERMLVNDSFDPRQNILGGTRYLRVLANLFNGNLRLTLAAYNAGENAVIRYRGIPPYEETQHYVTKVLEYYNLYRGQSH